MEREDNSIRPSTIGFAGEFRDCESSQPRMPGIASSRTERSEHPDSSSLQWPRATAAKPSPTRILYHCDNNECGQFSRWAVLNTGTGTPVMIKSATPAAFALRVWFGNMPGEDEGNCEPDTSEGSKQTDRTISRKPSHGSRSRARVRRQTSS